MNLQSEIGFVECLALHRNRRDTAVGLVHITSHQKGLIWYRNLLVRRAVSAALHAGVIKEIVAMAESAPVEEQAALLVMAKTINEKIRLGLGLGGLR